MSETKTCPFCSQTAEASLEDRENRCLFKCCNCGMFLMYNRTVKSFAEGKYASCKVALLKFIEDTPIDKIAYIGEQFSKDVPQSYELYRAYRPLQW